MLEFQESLGGGEVVESQPYPEEVPGILIHQQQEAWEVESSKKKKYKFRPHPAVAVRKSARISPSDPVGRGDFSSIPGNNHPTPYGFAVLNTCEEDDLTNITLNCEIILGENKTEIDATISAMQLEELSRAALAEASYNFNLEKGVSTEHCLEGENLSLEVVDNSQRIIQIRDKCETDKLKCAVQTSLETKQGGKQTVLPNGGNLQEGRACSKEGEQLDEGKELTCQIISEVASTSSQQEVGQKGGVKSNRTENKDRGTRLSRELKRISIQ